ncbi:LOW QUALITY PROTEIN: protein SHQ1 homolog [Ostrinia furnacalis]|uniref:LOW QUALITY PROTEIN: protein SHQ1 homolog n=1 Tax=Ostrinia furnacalis TaxID=93504 RepID=UPI00103EDFD2|nr:LOW QUALITY PROTEIN: protein SHQ1 homolog [Ostrinia furnacalis]
MLTPRFKLSQDANHVFITIHAPYTNIGDTEINVDGENFLFVSSPYFLRLRLPGRLVDNDSSKGSYTCDSGDFTLTFDKEQPGECFENLDMITSLLAPRDIPDVNPALVEMLDEDGITLDEHEEINPTAEYAVGFANKLTTEFGDLASEYPQIFELRDPQNVAITDRNNLRIQYEDDKFSPDHYLADLYEPELIFPYLEYTPFWDSPDYNNIDFTEDEISVLKELPNKSYLLTKTEKQQVMLGIIDILYGYCYDKRTTLNDSTVESSWTINKLSSTLSWFCVFNDIQEVLIACYRRALVFPIFRNFELCEAVKNDVTLLFEKGKKFIIKCFIEIHTMFNKSNDARYILNQLYIKDYLVFLQKCSNEDINKLHYQILNNEISKNDVELELEELEHAAQLVKIEHSQILENEMALKMASLNILGLGSNNDALNEEESEDDDSSYIASDSSEDSSDDLDSDDDQHPS